MAAITPVTLIATLESHLTPTLAFTSPPTSPSQPSLHLIPPPTLTKLRNIGPGRVKDMRFLGQSKQIISHVPLVAAPQTCSRINDAMHAAVIMNSEKFSVLSMLPLEGKEAARELARCVGKMKFVGGCIGISRKTELEGVEWEELWDAAERYRVPILLRETWPVGSEVCCSLYFGNQTREKGTRCRLTCTDDGLPTHFSFYRIRAPLNTRSYVACYFSSPIATPLPQLRLRPTPWSTSHTCASRRSSLSHSTHRNAPHHYSCCG